MAPADSTAPTPPTGPTYDQVRRWALVLDSQDIPNEMVHGPDGWGLVVDAPYGEAAAAALRAYYTENADRPEPVAPAIRDARATGLLNGATIAAVLVVALMAAFHLLVVLPDGTGTWYAAGTAAASPMLGGEPWRAITALTLHADVQHLLANTLAGLLFLALVFAALGPGVGAWLVLAAGALGNLANAALRGPGYGGVGASTAVFGAIGLLAGLRIGRYRRRQASRGEAWAAVFAAIMLLALTGLSPETDVLAHVWGFAIGLGLGLVAGHLPSGWIGPRGQWLLALAALATVVGAWVLALRAA